MSAVEDVSTKRAILELASVSKTFLVGPPGRRRELHAVQDVSLSVRPGETLGIVGESGSGKSTLANLIVRLLEPTSGRIMFDGTDVTALDERSFRPLRREVQMIFQDPYASLNPRMTVEQIVSEPLQVHHRDLSRAEVRDRVGELVEQCGLPRSALGRHPGSFSGGQQQRVGIARALALNPRVLICDEPVSALDVSVQAQILNLLASLQEQFGLAYVFISHDLGVVRQVADRVAVMYLGHLVEVADGESLYNAPRHPYTELLLATAPRTRAHGSAPDVAASLIGEIPSPIDPPSGCPFHPRCRRARELAGDQGTLPRDCVSAMPPLDGVACWHPLGRR